MNKHHNKIIEFCQSLPGSEEDIKWGNDLVFSVCKKMFAVFVLPNCDDITLKVPKSRFLELTEQEGIGPAPYLARHGWVTIDNIQHRQPEWLEEHVQTSYDEVVAKLSKKLQSQLVNME